MESLMNFFDDDFMRIFDKPIVRYNSAKTKDMSPMSWHKTDKGYKCACRSVGVAPDDVHVTVDADGFTIVNVVLTALPMFVDPLFVCTVTVTVALALLPIALIHVIGIA